MSTPISSIVFPGSEEEYLFRDGRIVDSETGAATSDDYGLFKLPEGSSLDEDGRIKLGADDLIATIGPATDEKLGLVELGFTPTKNSVPVQLDEDNNAYVEVGDALESTSASGVSFPFGSPRWLTYDFSADNHQSIKIKKGVKIRLDITVGDEVETRWYNADTDKHYDLSETMASFENINGTNFYVYLVPDEDDGVTIAVSKNSTYPNDVSDTYTANNTRKIGQFHTLCVAIPSAQKSRIASAHGTVSVGDKYLVKKYNSDDEDGFYNFYYKTISSITTNAIADLTIVEHPLAGFAAGDILPESVWCLNFHPFADPAGMVYDPNTGMAYDIYLQSGTGKLTASEYNVTHTVSREQQNHEDDFRQVGKRLLFSYEFQSMALGGNEIYNIAGSKDYGVVGGHVDTQGTRMTSFIGVEEACGYLWQWSNHVSNPAVNDHNNRNYDGLGWFGQTHGYCYGICFGGMWHDYIYSWPVGSRCKSSGNGLYCSYIKSYTGGRGVSQVIREA